MFKSIIRADALQSMLDSVGVLVDECKIHLDDGGIEIRAVDPANVGMVDLTLDAEAFESYEADGGLIGVNLVRLQDVVGMADSGELVELELDEETRKLHISISGLEYTLALIDPDSIREEPDLPDLDLPGTFVFEAAELKRAVTATDMVGDHVQIEAADEQTVIVTADGDTDSVELTLGPHDLLSGRLDTEDSIASLFSLDYLDDMADSLSTDTETSLLLGSEMPLKLRFSAADGALSVTFMLAPRIQSG